MTEPPSPIEEPAEWLEDLIHRVFNAGWECGRKPTGLQMVIASDVIEPEAVKQVRAKFSELFDEIEQKVIGYPERANPISDSDHKNYRYPRARNQLRVKQRKQLAQVKEKYLTQEKKG